MTIRVLRSIAAGLCLLAAGCAAQGPAAADAARLRQLEDRAQILELFTSYGATLDRRDFAAFGALFAEDAQYGSGTSMTRGRAAIQAQLTQVMGSNPSNLPTPNFHLFFNPSIRVTGDTASATSLGAYTAPDAATGSTRMVFFVTYVDDLVRQDGRWLFQRRVIGYGAAAAPAR